MKRLPLACTGMSLALQDASAPTENDGSARPLTMIVPVPAAGLPAGAVRPAAAVKRVGMVE